MVPTAAAAAAVETTVKMTCHKIVFRKLIRRKPAFVLWFFEIDLQL